MKKHRWILYLLIFSGLIYIILMGTLNTLLMKNRGQIEGFVADALQAEEVSIGSFWNIPFYSVKASKIEVRLTEDTSFDIDEIQVRYALIPFLIYGPERILRDIHVGEITSEMMLTDFITHLRLLTDEEREKSGEVPMLKTRMELESLKLKSALIFQIDSEVEIRDVRVDLNRNEMDLKGSFFLSVFIEDHMNYVKSGLDFEMDISDLTNLTINGKATINALNFGGISMLQNEKLRYYYSDGEFLTFRGSTLSNLLVSSNNTLEIAMHKPFTLAYEEFYELDMFEHLFENGEYQLDLDLIISYDEGLSFEAAISNSSGEILTWANGEQREGRFYLEGDLESEKFGDGYLDISFTPGERFPEGDLDLDNIKFTQGLRMSGVGTCLSATNTMKVDLEGYRINGGLIGSVKTLMVFDTTNRALYFQEIPGYEWEAYQARVTGSVFERQADILIEAQNVVGSAVVSNIFIDFFGLGKAKYDVSARLYTTPTNQFCVDGEFTGYRWGSLHNKGSVTVIDTNLTANSWYFVSPSVTLGAEFDFGEPGLLDMTLGIDGWIKPTAGKLISANGTIEASKTNELVEVKFNIDQGDLFLNVYGKKGSANVYAYTDSYDLSKIGIPGTLGGAFYLGMYGTTVTGSSFDGWYSYDESLSVDLAYSADYEDGILNLDEFLLALPDDTLEGSGTLWQTPGHMNGKIYFDRGGSVKFEVAKDDINALLDLRNIYIRDLLGRDLDVFATVKVNAYGELGNPDFYGSLSVLNSFYSEAFSLSVDSFSRSGKEITVEGGDFSYNDISLSFDGWGSLSEENIWVNAYGEAEIGGSFESSYSLTYQKKNDTDSFTYRLTSLSMVGTTIGDFRGGVIRQDDDSFYFYRYGGQNGVEGDLTVSEGYALWDLTAYSEQLSGESFGEVSGGKIDAFVSLNGDLGLLSFADTVVKEIDGEIQVELDFTGKSDSPSIDGLISVKDLDLKTHFLENEFKGGDFDIPVYNSKLVLSDFYLPTSKGDWSATGYIDLSDWQFTYLDVEFSTLSDEDVPVSLDIDENGIIVEGDIYVDSFRVTGSSSKLTVSGDVTAKKLLLSIGLAGALAGGSSSPDSVLSDIYWDVEVTMGSGVRFSNLLIDTTFDQGESLHLTGSFGDNSIALDGEITLSRGTFYYLNRDLDIDDGRLTFSGKTADLIPYIVLETSSRDKSSTGENIDIYLTFEGKLTTISVTDYYTVPDIPNSEIYVLLGIEASVDSETGLTNNSTTAEFLASSVDAAGNYLLNPLSSKIRQAFGLDMFVIRTGVLGNMVMSAGATNFDPSSLIAGTSVSFGKYLFSTSLFLEYEFSLEQNPYSSTTMIEDLHTVGLGFDFKHLYLGYKYAPYFDQNDVEYEHKVELNLHRSF